MTRVFVLLRSVFGVDFSAYRPSTVRRRVERRIALHRLDSVKEYVDFLREHPAEVEDLYYDILIRVTEFFREPDVYERLLDTVFPRILEGKTGDEPVRVWVPGCATGEEPYSIAMVLLRALKRTGRETPIKLFATDISERDIDLARAGVYAETKLDGVPDAYRHYFARLDAGYQVSSLVRDLCVFARHDVTSDPPFSGLDLVSCRNLLIYLGPAAQEKVIPLFHYALRPKGYLVLGTAESVGASRRLFSPDRQEREDLRQEAGRLATAAGGLRPRPSAGGRVRRPRLHRRD